MTDQEGDLDFDLLPTDDEDGDWSNEEKSGNKGMRIDWK